MEENIAIINLLLDRGADPNGVNDLEDSPLKEARMLKLTEIVELLIARGANETDFAAVRNKH
jgi:ankyrin repeat protein